MAGGAATLLKTPTGLITTGEAASWFGKGEALQLTKQQLTEKGITSGEIAESVPAWVRGADWMPVIGTIAMAPNVPWWQTAVRGTLDVGMFVLPTVGVIGQAGMVRTGEAVALTSFEKNALKGAANVALKASENTALQMIERDTLKAVSQTLMKNAGKQILLSADRQAIENAANILSQLSEKGALSYVDGTIMKSSSNAILKATSNMGQRMTGAKLATQSVSPMARFKNVMLTGAELPKSIVWNLPKMAVATTPREFAKGFAKSWWETAILPLRPSMAGGVWRGFGSVASGRTTMWTPFLEKGATTAAAQRGIQAVKEQKFPSVSLEMREGEISVRPIEELKADLDALRKDTELYQSALKGKKSTFRQKVQERLNLNQKRISELETEIKIRGGVVGKEVPSTPEIFKDIQWPNPSETRSPYKALATEYTGPIESPWATKTGEVKLLTQGEGLGDAREWLYKINKTFNDARQATFRMKPPSEGGYSSKEFWEKEYKPSIKEGEKLAKRGKEKALKNIEYIPEVKDDKVRLVKRDYRKVERERSRELDKTVEKGLRTQTQESVWSVSPLSPTTSTERGFGLSPWWTATAPLGGRVATLVPAYSPMQVSVPYRVGNAWVTQPTPLHIGIANIPSEETGIINADAMGAEGRSLVSSSRVSRDIAIRRANKVQMLPRFNVGFLPVNAMGLYNLEAIAPVEALRTQPAEITRTNIVPITRFPPIPFPEIPFIPVPIPPRFPMGIGGGGGGQMSSGGLAAYLRGKKWVMPELVTVIQNPLSMKKIKRTISRRKVKPYGAEQIGASKLKEV